MLKKSVILTMAVVIGLVLPSSTSAQELPTGEHGGRFGVGFQGSWPAYGISAIAKLNKQFALQGVVGTFGIMESSFFARGIYRFSPKTASFGWHNFYGYGSVGAFTYKLLDVRETVPGFGAGVGFEAYLESLPQMGWTVEVGFSVVNFDLDYSFSFIALGLGAHYYF